MINRLGLWTFRIVLAIGLIVCSLTGDKGNVSIFILVALFLSIICIKLEDE